MAKQIVLRFPAAVSQDYAGIRSDIAAFEQWAWTGPEDIQALVEIHGHVGPGKGFAIASVRFTPEDAEACLTSLNLADRIFAVDYEAAAREKAAKAAAKRQKADFMPTPKPASWEQVPPSLRFLLCDEARVEADRYYRETELLGPIGLRRYADELSDLYPFMARVDDLLGGAIRRCLRRGAEVQPPPGGPYPWHWCGICISNGNPQGIDSQVDGAMKAMAKFPPRRKEVSSTSRPHPTVTRTVGGENYHKPRDVSEEVFASFPAEHLHLLSEIARRALRDWRNPDQALRDWLASTSDVA